MELTNPTIPTTPLLPLTMPPPTATPLPLTVILLLTTEDTDTKNPNTTALFKMLLKSLKCVSLPSKPSAPTLICPSRLSLTKNSPTLSPALCALNPLKKSTTKSALTPTNKRQRAPTPRLSKSPSKSKKMFKWSLSANPDTDTVMDMEDMATTTARRLPKPPNTMSPLSPLSMSPLKLPTPKPSRPAATSPSPFPVLPVKTSLKKEPSLSPRSKMLLKPLRNATPNWLPLTAKRSNLLSPSKSVLSWSMDMHMNPSQLMPLLPTMPKKLLVDAGYLLVVYFAKTSTLC